MCTKSYDKSLKSTLSNASEYQEHHFHIGDIGLRMGSFFTSQWLYVTCYAFGSFKFYGGYDIYK